MSSLTLTGLAFGLVLGLRHAIEPDHLAVIATILTETRSLRRMARVGVVWGVGHGSSLLAVTFVLAALRVKLSTRVDDAFELLVALMLLGFGGRASPRVPRRARGDHVSFARHRS